MFFKSSTKRPHNSAQFPQRVGIKHPKSNIKPPHQTTPLSVKTAQPQKDKRVSSSPSARNEQNQSPLQRFALLALSVRNAKHSLSSPSSGFSPWQRSNVENDTPHHSGIAVPLPTSGALYKDVLRRRAVAAALDAIVVAIAIAFISTFFAPTLWAKGLKQIVSLSFFVTIMYTVLTTSGKAQATWGMQALGLKTVTTTGQKPKITSDILHVILGFAGSLFGLLIVIDTLSALFRSDRRMIRDRMTDYVIVRERALWEWKTLHGFHSEGEGT
jgi:uncharacterized RDD family membrane protein YckC